MAEPKRMLIIEDEVAIRRFLRHGLDPAAFTLLEAENGRQGLHLAATENPDLILLDLGLPDMDGVEVARDLREWSEVPVIVLSARGREQDKIDALDAGADDYMTKPFGMGELLARVRVALRHANKKGVDDPTFTFGTVRLDLSKRQVFRNDEEVHLTPNEYKMLAMLVRNAGKVLTHRQLLLEVWGPGYVTETHYLRVYMGQLRQKLEQVPAQPEFLINEPGVGYRLRVDA